MGSYVCVNRLGCVSALKLLLGLLLKRAPSPRAPASGHGDKVNSESSPGVLCSTEGRQRVPGWVEMPVGCSPATRSGADMATKVSGHGPGKVWGNGYGVSRYLSCRLGKDRGRSGCPWWRDARRWNGDGNSGLTALGWKRRAGCRYGTRRERRLLLCWFEGGKVGQCEVV